MIWTLLRAAIGFGIAFYVLHPHDVGAWLKAHAPTLSVQSCDTAATDTPAAPGHGNTPSTACTNQDGAWMHIPSLTAGIEQLRQAAR